MRLYFDCKYLDIVLFLSEYFLIHEQKILHSYLYDETALKSLLLFDFDRNFIVWNVVMCKYSSSTCERGSTCCSQVGFDKLLITPIFQTKVS